MYFLRADLTISLMRFKGFQMALALEVVVNGPQIREPGELRTRKMSQRMEIDAIYCKIEELRK